MNAKTVLKYASDEGAKFVSVRFTDLPGAWHHLSFPIEQLSEDSFEDGFGFDASSPYVAGQRSMSRTCCSSRRARFGWSRSHDQPTSA